MTARWFVAVAALGFACGPTVPGGTGERPPPSCQPTSCAELGKDCGTLPDGCGGELHCGSCAADETCGGDGEANVCGGAGCEPTSCEAEGKDCGEIPDGCGATLSCGACTEGETCGGAGTPNVCGTAACEPSTCEALGKQCGQASDGCGATLSCGTCAAGEVCEDNVCVAAEEDTCRGLALAEPGAPRSWALPETISYLERQCTTPTSDGTGWLAFPVQRSRSHQVYFVSPEGVRGDERGGYRYEVFPQLKGFTGVNSVGLGESYTVEALSSSGASTGVVVQAPGSAFGARDPLGGVVVFVRDAEAPEGMAWLESFDEDLQRRWRVQIPFAGYWGMAVDRRGQTLVLGARDGALRAVWVSHEGEVGAEFTVLSPAPSAATYELAPRVGDGLFLASWTAEGGWRWLKELPSGVAHVAEAPQWLRARPDTQLQMARGGRAYAVTPRPRESSSCSQRLELASPDGEVCATLTFDAGDGPCEMQTLTVGYDGTLIQRLPQQLEECVTPDHCKCGWRWWPRLLK